MTDRVLIQKILSRDRKALYTFYRTYNPKLSAYISAKVGNREDAEEILQDTMFGFLESLRDFHGGCKLTTYLFSICSHKVIDYYRRKKLKSIVFSQMPEFESLISPLLGPEEELDTTLLREKIKKAFRSLLPRYKLILEMKYLEDLSVSDIAKHISTSFKSAESQLFRARRAFVRAFTGNFEYERSTV